jgi:hypothetical protein
MQGREKSTKDNSGSNGTFDYMKVNNLNSIDYE